MCLWDTFSDTNFSEYSFLNCWISLWWFYLLILFHHLELGWALQWRWISCASMWWHMVTLKSLICIFPLVEFIDLFYYENYCNFIYFIKPLHSMIHTFVCAYLHVHFCFCLYAMVCVILCLHVLINERVKNIFIQGPKWCYGWEFSGTNGDIPEHPKILDILKLVLSYYVIKLWPLPQK